MLSVGQIQKVHSSHPARMGPVSQKDFMSTYILGIWRPQRRRVLGSCPP